MDYETREKWQDLQNVGFFRFVMMFGFVNFLAAAVLIGLVLWLAMPAARMDDVLQVCLHRLSLLPVIGVILTATFWTTISGRS